MLRKCSVSKLFLAAVGIAVCAGCPGAGRDVKKSQTRLDLAADELKKGHFDEAEQEAQQALRYDDGNEEAHYLLGMVDQYRALSNLRLVEQFDCLTGVDAEVLRTEMDQHLRSADMHFGAAVELAPDYGEAWKGRALVAEMLGDHDRAIVFFERALSNRSRLDNIGFTRSALGWAHFQNG